MADEGNHAIGEGVFWCGLEVHDHRAHLDLAALHGHFIELEQNVVLLLGIVQ